MEKSLKEMLITELLAQHQATPVNKDILIVIHNQLELTKRCIESLLTHTSQPFNIYLWDNASDKETHDYLLCLTETYSNIHLSTSAENIGFIDPNNKMICYGNSPYVILLNNDTEVSEGWDKALIGYLQLNPDIYAVGYQGGLLSEDGVGINSHTGTEIDYIMGWCLCITRDTYKRHGLFDNGNLQFAYGEDSDFSLRLREAGKKIYALNLELVKHHAHQTTAAIKNKRSIRPEFVANHQYIYRRWGNYLKDNRILKQYPDTEKAILDAWEKLHGTKLNLTSLVEACL